MKDLVDNSRLREAFLERDMTAGEVARNMGWARKRSGWDVIKADDSRVLRSLGLRGYVSNGRKIVRSKIEYDTAVQLALAMHLDPVDVDL